ncbi:MAG TPA: ubiquitin-like domain-containing protein [Jiangellaceae bacterium]|nr:ubiquitin-like domain-containing protein [Jiangellaceae bacterium]
MKTLAINATVITALVGGMAAYTTFNNTVLLSIDGKTETVQTFADTVDGVLEDKAIEIGEHDVVVPAPSTPVEDGLEIAVRYARLVTVNVDGVDRQFWTTALSVEEALADLGIRAAGAELSVSRSLGIGRRGLDFEVRTPKDIVLVADGEEREVTTTALTIREALRDLDLELGDRDLIEPGPEDRVVNGLELIIKRVSVEEETRTIAIEHKTQRKSDDSMYKDQSKVEREGKDGKIERVVEIIYIDGEKSEEKVLSETVVADAVDRIVVEGTKARPVASPSPTSSGGSGGSSGGGSSGGDAGVWDRLAQCESGGNWSINTGNGYYGGLQFSLGTWQAYGGTGYPHENSKAEQIRIAQKVRDARGHYGDWPACARKLGLPTS